MLAQNDRLVQGLIITENAPILIQGNQIFPFDFRICSSLVKCSDWLEIGKQSKRHTGEQIEIAVIFTSQGRRS
jgi:hypothetical protein